MLKLWDLFQFYDSSAGCSSVAGGWSAGGASSVFSGSASLVSSLASPPSSAGFSSVSGCNTESTPVNNATCAVVT